MTANVIQLIYKTIPIFAKDRKEGSFENNLSIRLALGEDCLPQNILLVYCHEAAPLSLLCLPVAYLFCNPRSAPPKRNI